MLVQYTAYSCHFGTTDCRIWRHCRAIHVDCSSFSTTDHFDIVLVGAVNGKLDE